MLGLDPGSRYTGWGLLVGNARTASVLGCGRLSPRRGAARPAALASLALQLEELLARLDPDVVAVESLFTARFPQSALALAETRGALIAALGRWGGPVHEYAPARVKAAVVGLGRAEKQQVAFIVRQALNLSEMPPPDAADALAVALCHLRQASP